LEGEMSKKVGKRGEGVTHSHQGQRGYDVGRKQVLPRKKGTSHGNKKKNFCEMGKKKTWVESQLIKKWT